MREDSCDSRMSTRGSDRVQLRPEFSSRRIGTVAFQHHRRRLMASAQVGQQLQYRRRHRIGVGVVIDAVGTWTFAATCQVDIRDPFQRELVEERVRRLAPVPRVGIHVGHVEQQQCTGPVEDLGQELTFGQLVVRPVETAAIGSSANGTDSSGISSATLRTTASTASRVRGRGSR